MESVLVLILYQYFWVAVIFVLVANAAFWRYEAIGRIKDDPSLRRPLNRLYAGFAFWTSLPFIVMGGGIASGFVDSIFDYLIIDTQNPFVVAFLALLFAEDALFIYWVFFRRGDHLLALHTELTSARPKFRVAVRVLAGALPLLHCSVLYYTTVSPHFGQFLGANPA